jgi:hypothetical protein
MQNTNENNAREGRAKINPDEMDKLREIYFSIIDWDQNGANINDEIGHFLVNVADPGSVCRVANFVVDGRRQVEDEADFTGEPTLMATWNKLLERLIPWLESRGYEKHGIFWQSPGSE